MIWIMAGTADSYQVIEELISLNKKLIVSVTSKYGKKIVESKYPIKAYQDKLDFPKMKKFCIDKEIEYIIDATHPFAKNASINAIATASELNIDYIRYERENINLEQYSNNLLIKVKSYQEAAQKASQYKNIFLTTGSKSLDIFAKEVDNYQSRITARILPVIKYLKKAYKIGLKPVNILAAQGPFTIEFNQAAFKEYKADVIVTKAAGKTGGLEEKLKAASQLKIPVIIIKRPEISYPVCYHHIEELIEYLEG